VSGAGLFLGAYWGDRPESHEACAARLRRTIESLEAIDPVFRRWRLLRPGRLPVPLPREPALLPDLVLGGRRRRDSDDGVIRELGCALAAASSLSGLGAHLHVRCGQAASTPGIVNSVLLQPFRTGQADDIWLRESDAIVRAVVAAWDPDWAVLGPRTFRAAQSQGDREPHASAVTYLADWLGRPPALPGDVRVVRLPQGTLLSLVQDDRLPEVELALRTARALRAAGLLQAVPQVQAHPVP
jgi:hypothetical protein